MALLQEILVPLLAVNDTSLTVVEINFSSGSRVKKGDLLMVFETSKTTYDVEAGEEGWVQFHCEIDRDYEVNAIAARIYSEEEEAKATIPTRQPVFPGNGDRGLTAGQAGQQAVIYSGAAMPQTQSGLPAGTSDLQATEAVRPLWNWEGETLFSHEASRLIGSAGINPSIFAGRDFVTAADVLEFQQPAPGSPAATIPGQGKAGLSGMARVLPVDPAKVDLKKLSSGKKREIEYLGEVQSTGLTSTIHIFVETEGIFTHINRSLRYLKDSLLPVIVYEASRLLADHPLLNAYFAGDTIACYKEVNPGFAIDIDKGLKVLKIAGAGEKAVGEIEEAILRLSGSYLDDTIAIEDLTDITFTITDLSSEGVAIFRPLINKMNSAILGVSAIDTRLQRCALSLTFDHRVTEGKSAALFLRELKERLESYRSTEASPLKDISCFKCLKTLKEDLGGTGFVRCITPEGIDGYICQSCLKGF